MEDEPSSWPKPSAALANPDLTLVTRVGLGG